MLIELKDRCEGLISNRVDSRIKDYVRRGVDLPVSDHLLQLSGPMLDVIEIEMDAILESTER